MVDHSRFPRAHASYLAALPSTRLIPNLRVFASLTMTALCCLNGAALSAQFGTRRRVSLQEVLDVQKDVPAATIAT